MMQFDLRIFFKWVGSTPSKNTSLDVEKAEVKTWCCSWCRSTSSQLISREVDFLWWLVHILEVCFFYYYYFFFHVFFLGGPFAKVAALLILAFHPVMKDLMRQPNNTKLLSFEAALGGGVNYWRTLDLNGAFFRTCSDSRCFADSRWEIE